MKWSRFILAVGSATFLALGATTIQAEETDALKTAFRVVDEYKSPGLEAEVSGIYPYPGDSERYLALINSKPPYRYQQKPMVDEAYHGHLVVVRRDGSIERSIRLADDDFGGLARAGDRFFAALTNQAEIIEFDLESGRITRHIGLPSPAGGLEYDADRDALIAQHYVGYPHLSVIDRESGTVTETLWSDESAMGLAKVDGDWLCTWASGWDPGSFGELRVLDQGTGKIRARVRLDEIHSSLAPVESPDSSPRFMSLVTTDSHSGETVVRAYEYRGERQWAQLLQQ